MLDDVAGERFGQILQRHGLFFESGKFDERFRKGEFVRSDVLAEEDDGAPVVFRRALSLQKFGHRRLF